MRGNLPAPRKGVIAQGSIPAYAGEPEVDPAPPKRLGVYPRVCGGTHCGLPPGSSIDGLSPRMRGNRPSCASLRAIRGSIPAYAGEPNAPARAAS